MIRPAMIGTPMRARPRRSAAACVLAAGLAFGGAAPAAAGNDEAALSARILELEQLGRAHPTEAARQLEALRDATPVHGAQRLELLTVQGLMFAVASQLDAAERPAEQLRTWGDNPKAPLAPLASASALLIRARGMARNGNLLQADAMMRDAIARLPADEPPRERYRFLLAQAFIKNEAGRLEDAVRIYHAALELADAQGEAWRQAEVRSSLANSYFYAGQLDRAKDLAAQSRRLAEAAQDMVGLGKAYSITGIVADGLGDRQGERQAFEQAIDCARRAGSKVDEVSYLANLSDFYLKNAEYKTALDRAERALVIARELHDTSSETVALANIGLAQVSLQHIELGMRSVREAIAIEERRGSVTGASEIFGELGTYLEKAGDLSGAIAAYHQHRRLDTTLRRDDQQKAILALQAQYDADHRNHEIALLNREHDLKAEQLHQRALQQRLWTLLAVASLLSFAAIALLYHRVRRTNRMLLGSNEMLRLQSERDPLTGLANRRHFQAAMRRLAADGRLSGTIFLIDIDHFKRINDRHGHGVGDTVLVEVARRLRETLREEDLIVRWGGEEFLVVVQALAADQVDTLAQRMLGTLDLAPVTAGPQRVMVSASIGYASFPIGPALLTVPWERAINLVDTAMYLAKAHGRNRAYGVRLLQACDEATLEKITRSLEGASRDGRVALTLLQGRKPPALAA